MKASKQGVLYLTPGCFDKGGISRYSRYQIEALRELYGHDSVSAFSLLGRDSSSFEHPFEVDWSAGGVAPGHKARFATRTIAHAVKRRPKCVVAAHVNLSPLARLAAALAGGIAVVNVYGLEVWSGLRRGARRALRNAEGVISDCHFTARYLEDAGLRTGPVRVLWDCVDTGRFTPGAPDPSVVRRYGMPDPSRYTNVLTLGRMAQGAAHKGYDRLISAFAIAATRSPTLRLVMAGKGDMVEGLKRRAAEHGVIDRVSFVGPVHEDDLVSVYRAAHLFSLVSDRGPGRGEGIPLTPLEAASCGLPIVVGNQDGSIEAVDEGASGYAIDPFDLERHASVMVQLGTDVEVRQKMGEAARRRVVAHHDYQVFRREQGAILRAFGVATSAEETIA